MADFPGDLVVMRNRFVIQFLFGNLHSIIFHVIGIESHESNVDDSADSDEELGEGVEDKIGEDLSTLDPDSGAIPDAEKVATSFQTIHHNVFDFWSLIVLVLRITFSERQILQKKQDFYLVLIVLITVEARRSSHNLVNYAVQHNHIIPVHPFPAVLIPPLLKGARLHLHLALT